MYSPAPPAHPLVSAHPGLRAQAEHGFGSGDPTDPGERGFALLLTVFIVALATILVVDFADQMRAFQSSSRSYVESVQSNFMLKSALNLGLVLLEAPKLDETQGEDSLLDPWAKVASFPSIPIDGFIGEVRLMIVDEDGKLDLNALEATAVTFPGSQAVIPGATGGAPAPGADAASVTGLWRKAFYDLFSMLGFARQSFPEKSFRTLGNTAYDAADQVAVLTDWVDRDTEPFRAEGFQGQGIESQARKDWFYNRSFKTLSELALVPGMTLERVQQIAPFVKVSSGFSTAAQRAVNVNTAPYEVLLTLCFTQAQAEELLRQRLNLPITKEILQTLTTQDPACARMTKVNSGEFSIYSRVKLPTRTSWMRATVGLVGTGVRRKAAVRTVEFY